MSQSRPDYQPSALSLSTSTPLAVWELAPGDQFIVWTLRQWWVADQAAEEALNHCLGAMFGPARLDRAWRVLGDLAAHLGSAPGWQVRLSPVRDLALNDSEQTLVTLLAMLRRGFEASALDLAEALVGPAVAAPLVVAARRCQELTADPGAMGRFQILMDHSCGHCRPGPLH